MSLAFFFSTKVITVLIPWRTTGPLLVGLSSLPAARASARSLKRSFLSCLVSGRYLSNNLNNWVAVCLSRACENWLIGGGTFNLVGGQPFVSEDECILAILRIGSNLSWVGYHVQFQSYVGVFRTMGLLPSFVLVF